jgi:hypothetical protein
LEALLALNGYEIGGVLSMGTTSFPYPPEDPESPVSNHIVRDVKRVHSGEGEYVVALTEIKCPQPLGHRSDAVFIFSTEGELLETFGGTACDVSAISMVHLQVRTLGSQHEWFVIITDMATADDVSPPFQTATSVYLLEEGFPHALQVYHYMNDWGTTQTPVDVNNLRFAALFFYGPEDRPALVRERLPEMLPDASIRWDDSGHVFRGRSQLIVDGVPVFRVNVEKSEAFEEAIDGQ